MKDLLDLTGGSGAVYRFQLIRDEAKVPAEGGNYVYVRRSDDAVSVIFCGVSDTLHDSRAHWGRAVGEYGANAIYVRRNITRSQREREHDDIIAATSPPMQSAV